MNRTQKTGRSQKIKVRPQPYGWFLLFLMVWVPLAAMVTVNNFLYIMFTLMIGLLVVSNRLGKKNLQSVTVSRRFPEDVFAGTVFPLDYVVKSDRKPWGSFDMTFEEVGTLERTGPPVTFPRVPLSDSATFTGYFSIPLRGDRLIGAGILSSTFPFGLARYTRSSSAPDTVLVFPGILPVEDEIPPWLGGRGRGVERADPFGTVPYLFRDYVPGDRFKHIDWKKTASSGTLITRILADEGAREIIIRLPAGASERAISRAASLVVYFGLSGRPVSLDGPGLKTEARAGREFTRHLLTVLARWDQHSQEASEAYLSPGTAVEIDETGEFNWHQAGDSYELNRQYRGKGNF
jgi:uncharacterized protein (DUF58 family)